LFRAMSAAAERNSSANSSPPSDRAETASHGGAHNRLGYAIQLCAVRSPGRSCIRTVARLPSKELLAMAARESLTPKPVHECIYSCREAAGKECRGPSCCSLGPRYRIPASHRRGLWHHG
jgi:hypothetical protein